MRVRVKEREKQKQKQRDREGGRGGERQGGGEGGREVEKEGDKPRIASTTAPQTESTPETSSATTSIHDACVDFTECIYQSVSAGRAPQKIINLFFSVSNSSIKFMVFVGGIGQAMATSIR